MVPGYSNPTRKKFTVFPPKNVVIPRIRNAKIQHACLRGCTWSIRLSRKQLAQRVGGTFATLLRPLCLFRGHLCQALD